MRVKQNRDECSGCSACYAACPVGAIEMRQDEEGFLYPEVDPARCIHCNLCRQVCPFKEDYRSLSGIDKAEGETGPGQGRFWAAVDERQGNHSQSRSGGVAAALAEWIAAQGGVAYGVSLDEQFTARFERAAASEQVDSFRGSKYVQASKGDVFRLVGQDLKQGKRVLFTGTACEVAGLRSLIRQQRLDDRLLYTVDIICHGVASPTAWKENIDYLRNGWHTEIKKVDFRDRSMGWKSHIESYVCRDGVKRYSNRYTSLYYASVIIRPCCHNCPFCNYDRVGDMTIGDFWGALRSGDKALRRCSGYSQVMINSRKGESLFREVQGIKREEITEKLFSYQPNLYHPTPVSAGRERFWAVYKKDGFARASGLYHTLAEKMKIPYNKVYRKVKGL